MRKIRRKRKRKGYIERYKGRGKEVGREKDINEDEEKVEGR